MDKLGSDPDIPIENLYKKTSGINWGQTLIFQEGFDDDIMREAVKNSDNRTRPYDLLGFDVQEKLGSDPDFPIGGNTKSNAANDTTITNYTLQEYHHTTKEVSNRGLFKGVTAITSAMIDIFTLPINLTIAVSSPVLKNTNHPLQKALDKVALDFVTDNLDYDKLRNKYKDVITTTNITTSRLKLLPQ